MAQVSFSRSTSSKGNCVKIVSSEALRGTPEERIEQFQDKSLGFVEDLIRQGIDPAYTLPSQAAAGGGGGGLSVEEVWYPTIQNEFGITGAGSEYVNFGVHLRSPGGYSDLYMLTPGDIGDAGGGNIQFYIPDGSINAFTITSSTRSNYSLVNSGTITATIATIPATIPYNVSLAYSFDPLSFEKNMNITITVTGTTTPSTISYTIPMAVVGTQMGSTAAPYVLPTLISDIVDNVIFTSPALVGNTAYTGLTSEAGGFAPLPIGFYAGDTTFGGVNILRGLVAPTTEGVSGDYYIKVDNIGTTSLYGPKTASWPALPNPAGGSNDHGYSFGATGTVSGNPVAITFFNLFQGTSYKWDYPSYNFFGNIFSPGYLSVSAVEFNRRLSMQGSTAGILEPSSLNSYGLGTVKYFEDFLLRKGPMAVNPPAEILSTDPRYKAIQDMASTFWPILTKTSDYIGSINEEECNPAGSGVRNTATDLCGKTCMEITASPATSL
jgi:hypothetical protein